MHLAKQLVKHYFRGGLDRRFATCKDGDMDIRSFLSRYGRAELAAIAKRAGTTAGYVIDQIGNGHRRPSTKLALKLWEASNRRLTLQKLRPDLSAWRKS